MRPALIAIVSVLVAAGIPCAARDDRFPPSYLDAREYLAIMESPPPGMPEKMVDQVVVKTGEKVVLDDHGYPAKAVAFLTSGTYETMVEDLPRLLATKGIAVTKRKEGSSRGYAEATSGSPEYLANVTKDLAKVAAIGVRLEGARACEVMTGEYNVLPAIRGHSVLRVIVLDGQRLFGKRYVLVLMTRYDGWHDWTEMRWTGQKLPIKGPTGLTTVTETEMDFFQALTKEANGAVVGCYFTNGLYGALWDVRMMEEIVSDIGGAAGATTGTRTVNSINRE